MLICCWYGWIIFSFVSATIFRARSCLLCNERHDLTNKPCHSVWLILRKGKFSNFLSEKGVSRGNIFSEKKGSSFGPWMRMWLLFWECASAGLSTQTLFGLVKSVQSALSDLLTTSATHDTFSRPSTKPGLILLDLELNTNARESFEHCWSYSLNLSIDQHVCQRIS